MPVILLINAWAVLLVNSIQLILCLSILVILHEAGHYWAARFFGCRVEKFYLFFDPWFSLWKKKIGETDFGIGWLPLGGYIRISGMAEISMKKKDDNYVPQSWEFGSKPAWQRFIIVMAGVTVNVILSVLLLFFIYYGWGKEQLPISKLKYGVSPDSLAASVGIREGDMITHINGNSITYFEDINKELGFSPQPSIRLHRNGQDTTILMPKGFISKFLNDRIFLLPRFPVIVGSISPSIKYRYGLLKTGDRIVAINHTTTDYYTEFTSAKQGYKAGHIVDLTIIRNLDSVSVGVEMNKEGKLDIECLNAIKTLGSEKANYTIPEAWSAAVGSLINVVKKNIQYIFLLTTSSEHKLKDNLRSIFSKGYLFGGNWNLQRFLLIVAYFSISLAFFNSLPIPGLDGGHASFAFYEIVTGREPRGKVSLAARVLGIVILLVLTIGSIAFDIWRLFK